MKIFLDIGLVTILLWSRSEIPSRARPIVSICPESGQAFQGQVRLQESFRLAGCGEEGFRGQITASDSALHRGRPPGSSPIAGEKKIPNGATLRRSPAVHAR